MVGLVHHLAITLLKGRDVLACNFAKYAYSLIKKMFSLTVEVSTIDLS